VRFHLKHDLMTLPPKAASLAGAMFPQGGHPEEGNMAHTRNKKNGMAMGAHVPTRPPATEMTVISFIALIIGMIATSSKPAMTASGSKTVRR
jgi:hypothetical protein